MGANINYCISFSKHVYNIPVKTLALAMGALISFYQVFYDLNKGYLVMNMPGLLAYTMLVVSIENGCTV